MLITRTRAYTISFICLLALILPTASVFAQSEPEVSSNAGAYITLGLLGLIFVIIMVVAVIAAVSLGIIGLGYWSVSDDEG